MLGKWKNRQKGITRGIGGMLLIVLLGALFWPVSGEIQAAERAEKKVVRVGWYESANFQMGTGNSEEKGGYSYEYLQRVADYTDWEYEYVYGEWPELLEKLSKGEVDIMAGVSSTEERRKTIFFPDYMMGTEHYYIYQHSDRQTMNQADIDSFKGRKVGGVKDNRISDYLKLWAQNNQAEYEIIDYDSFEARDRDFADYKIDGIAATDNNFTSDSEASLVVKVGEEPYYLAVTRKRRDLLAELNVALQTIESSDPYFRQQLEFDSYGATLVSSALSDKEEQWLENHPTIRIGYMKDYMPFSGVKEDGTVNGIVTKAVQQLTENLHSTVPMRFSYVGYDSFKEMGEAIAKGEIDISFPTIKDRDYLNEMQILGSKEVLGAPFNVAYKGNYSPEIFDVIALNSRAIKEIRNEYPNSQILKVETGTDCLDAILEGTATCTITSSYRLQEILNNPKYWEIQTMPFSANISYCFGVSKQDKELLTLVNKGVALMDKADLTNQIFLYIQEDHQYTTQEFVQDHMLEIAILGLILGTTIIAILLLNLRVVKNSNRAIECKNEELAGALERVNILATLSQDYEVVHIMDLDAGTFETIRWTPELDSVYSEAFPEDYWEAVQKVITMFVAEREQEAFLAFLNPDAMKERMEAQDCFVYRYAAKQGEAGRFIYEMRFVRVALEEDRHLLIAGTKCIDDVLAIEREEGLYNAALLHDSACFYEFDVSEGKIYGNFINQKGYDPLFGLKIEFPLSYDAFNRIRMERLGFQAATPKESSYWTCKGLEIAYQEGKRAVEIRYVSDKLDFAWNATIILTEDEASHHLHAVYICKDVTELVETEQKQKRALEKALTDAKRANAIKSEFLSRMSHDIRTPLNGIIGLLEISEKHKDDVELVNENRKKAKVASNHLLSLINDVLDMSKLEDEQTELPEEAFDIRSVCEEVVTICSIRARENGVTPTYDFGTNLVYPNVFGSPLHIKQVIMNLVNNAIKYNKVGGRIWCSTELKSYDGATVVYDFIVKDTGIGISKEYLKQIYLPFTQERNDARSRYQGTGMGMAIVKALVDKMNGTIRVESEVGVGTTFVVTLPFRVNHNAVATGTAEQEERPQSVAGMRVLLVEDNELNREIAQTILEDAGVTVFTAENGQIAYEMFVEMDAGSYDVILMDIMMPELDGYGATEKIRNLSRKDARSIPIIAMTANAFAEDVRKSKQAGMNDHLSKPLETKKLFAMLAKYKR